MPTLISNRANSLCLLTLACLALPCYGAQALGIFEDHTDVGTVIHPGSVEYDASKKTYTISGSGENMWFDKDAFQFAWKKLSGDVEITADISFIGAGHEAHRKAVLMIRQSLNADSPYADIARHGDGLTSLQAREEKGVNTTEIQSPVKAPTRVRIAKHGDYFYVSVAGEGEPLQFFGSMRVPMHEPFYVGLGVCSHNKDIVEQAVFSNVELTPGATTGTASPKLYSTLEVVPVSGDRRVVYVTPGRISDPSWTADGTALIFHHEGHTERIAVTGGQPEVVANSDTKASGEQPLSHTSPDGQQVVTLSYGSGTSGGAEDQDATISVRSIKDGKTRVLAKFMGGKGTMGAPNWSPDSRRVTFVSYQWVP